MEQEILGQTVRFPVSRSKPMANCCKTKPCPSTTTKENKSPFRIFNPLKCKERNLGPNEITSGNNDGGRRRYEAQSRICNWENGTQTDKEALGEGPNSITSGNSRYGTEKG